MRNENDIEESRPDPWGQKADRRRIDARCPRFVCRICRTKTGWPHQLGCEMWLVTAPECADCRYWSAKKSLCDHPAARKERAAK